MHVFVISAILWAACPVYSFVGHAPVRLGGLTTPRDPAVVSMNARGEEAAVGRKAFVQSFVSSATVGGIVAGVFSGVGEAGAAKYQQEYLVEPTAEFKAMEAKQAEFAKQQRAYKADFMKEMEAFLASGTDEDAITNLRAMTSKVQANGALPAGMRANDFLKTCRRHKGEMKDSGKWGTPVQIAYEELVAAINKSVVPLQTDK